MSLFVIGIGSVYALLFNQPIGEFLPYVASNYVVWLLISGILADSANVFVTAERYMRQEALPRTTFILRNLLRNFVNFAHNLVIVPIAVLAMGGVPDGTWLLVIPGLVLVALAGFFTTMLLGVLCTRFRDMPQVVQNLVQLAFFLTPVMWPAKSLKGSASMIVDWNPFAAMMQIVAEPMRNQVPAFQTYALAIATIVILGALALPLFARFRARIVYWL